MALLAVPVGAVVLAARAPRGRRVRRRRDGRGEPGVHALLKLLLDRPRPPAADQLVAETNESLPSGHATMSVVVIGSLVVLAWAGAARAARVAMVAAAAAWIGAVGATRIYLGVHWFCDVLAGWLVGAAWLALCVTLWLRWRARVPA